MNGLKHGNGKYTIENDMIYEGNWLYGQREGYGKIKWQNSNFYEGEL